MATRSVNPTTSSFNATSPAGFNASSGPPAASGGAALAEESPARGPLRLWLIRLFFLGVAVVIVVETLPRRFGWARAAKDHVSPVTNRVGLWQGEWPLFAPDPVLNNAWLSAELRAPDGQLTTWNSTYWGTTSGLSKFRHFRTMNLNNRIADCERVVRDDFSDFIARSMMGPGAQAVQSLEAGAGAPAADGAAETWKLRLFRNRLNISLPAEGGFPSRDDTLWISSSVNFSTREYLP